MNRVVRSSLAIGIGFVSAAATIQATGISRGPDPEPVLLGDLDVYGYCGEQFGESANALLLGGNAWAWKCVHRPEGVFTQEDIEFVAACRGQYGMDDATAVPRDGEDPHSWECFAP